MTLSYIISHLRTQLWEIAYVELNSLLKINIHSYVELPDDRASLFILYIQKYIHAIFIVKISLPSALYSKHIDIQTWTFERFLYTFLPKVCPSCGRCQCQVQRLSSRVQGKSPWGFLGIFHQQTWWISWCFFTGFHGEFIGFNMI